MNTRITLAVCLTVLLGACLFAERQARAGTIPAARVTGEVIAYLDDAYASSDIDVSFSLPRAQNIGVPGVDSLRLAISHTPVELPARSVPVNIAILDSTDVVLRRFRQVARVRMYAEALVVTESIDRDEVLSPEKVALKRVDVTGVKDYFTSYDAITGMQSKKLLRQGAVLSPNHVRPAYVVSRGDPVMVEVHNKDIVVRTTGIARRGGSLGEEILVYITMTRITVPGVIIDDDTVLTGSTGG